MTQRQHRATRSGSCLCGARSYEIDGEIDGVWICHCSLCRKATGGNGIAIVVIPRDRFRWLTGADHGETFTLRPTWSITRCQTCGTPLPAEEDDDNIYLTAATLDEPLGVGIRTRIFMASKADWDFEEADVRHFDARSRSTSE